MNNTVYLSLGSNIGDKFYNLLAAITELDKLPQTAVTKVSKFYETEPWGYENQDYFINCAVELRTALLPYELLKRINGIETLLKRKRLLKWGPRSIDIDIIFYDTLKIDLPELSIPHPRYFRRNFVLIPIMDIFYDKKEIAKHLNGDAGSIKEYKYDKPILISSCLMGIDCNYKGGNSTSKLFADILKDYQYKLACPEVLGGLEIPRVPAEISGNRVITKNGADVTENFRSGAQKTLEIVKNSEIEIAILKQKSPSCGCGSIYDGSFSSKLISGNGLTAELLLKNGINIISI